MYVLKGLWDDEEVYYQKVVGNMFEKIPIVKLTTSIDEATTFDSIESAEIEYENVSKNIFKIYPVCPYCGKDYSEHPAISRKDNKTRICPTCGIGEAFVSFINEQNPKDEDFGKKVLDFVNQAKKTIH